MAAEALRTGADDYFTKEATFAQYDRLLNSIQRVVRARGESERKRQAERALRESEERYRNLVERVQIGICLIQDRVLKFVNLSMAMMFGYTIDEMIGRPFTDYVVPRQIPRLLELYERRLQGEQVESNYETILVRRDGSEINAEVNAVVISVEGIPTDLVMIRDITEPKRIIRALQESEERFRSLVEDIDQSLYVVDLKGVITYISPAVENHSGWKTSELEGSNFSEFIHAADRQKLPWAYRRALRGNTEPFECRYIMRDGHTRHALISVNVLRNEEGLPTGLTGVITDISLSKRAELVHNSILRISEEAIGSETLQDFYTKIHDVIKGLMTADNFYIALYDEDNDLINFDYFVDQIDDQPPPMHPGRSRTGYVLRSGDMLHLTPAIFEKLHAAGEIDALGTMPVDWLGVPLRVRSKTIGVLVVQSYTEGMRYGPEEEEILQFVSNQVALSIERKRAEEEQRKQEDKYRNLFEYSSDMIFLHDLQGNITDVNRAVIEQLGYCAEELLQMTIAQLHPPDALEASAEAFKAITADRFVSFEIPFLRKDGSVMQGQVNSRLIEVGDNVYVQGVVRDTGERGSRDGDEGTLYRKGLEERTRLLFNMNRELKAFAYSVSHDLRKPLRHIDGYTSILQDEYSDRLDEKGREYIVNVRKAVSHVSDLIEALLSLSRVTSADLELEQVDLSEMAENILQVLASDEPERLVEAVVEEGVTATADKRMMRLVLENLLNNAWKFTSERENARIEFGRETVGGSEFFFVRDNGAGFDQAKAEQLFAPFSRLHSSERFAGTGIGLATVQRIVHRHGGVLEAEGKEDEGAVFRFTLSGERNHMSSHV